MIFFGFSLGFISAMGAFPGGYTSPFNPGNDTSLGITTNLTRNITGTGSLSWGETWALATGLTLLGVGVFSILTGTTNMLGVYLFGTFFWSSWASLVGILYEFDFLTSSAGLILVSMITVGMSIMFVGAIIGMLSGSNQLR